ncbi:MAG: SGNH/GDSL hydrolase family protein [Planctomycetota bacterium]
MRNLIQKHNKIRLAARVIFGAIYCFAACELFLRIFSPVPLTPLGWRVTSYGLRGNETNRTYRHTSPEYRITIKTNSKGIRADRDIPYEKADGVKRIVLLGDSFAMGCGVDLEDTFSSQMQKFLEESGVNSEIVNLGVPAYGNAEQFILLKEEGLKYHPDLVLLAWHPSDYSENVNSNLFSLEDGRLARKNKAYLPKARIREFLFQFKAYRWIAENSQFYRFIRHFVYLHVRRPLGAGIKRISSVFRAKPNNASLTAERQEGQNKSESSYRKELTIALLKEMKRQCISNGAGFLIFDIPIKLSRTQFESRFLSSEGSTTEHFEVFNPIELFKQQKGKKIYWDVSDGHFTPLGCRIIGEGLAKLILSKGLLKTNSRRLSNNCDNSCYLRIVRL